MSDFSPDVFSPGRGVFETLKVLKGIPLFVQEHRSALEESAQILGLDFQAEMLEWKKLPWGNDASGRWRWILDPAGFRTTYHSEELVQDQPISLSISLHRLGSKNWDARYKTLSYLTHYQARQSATTSEVVLLNEFGQVASAAMANIFWVIEDRLYTPSHEMGCREGVIRDFVRRKRPVRFGAYGLHDLFLADEIFLTNSIKGILSVAKLEDRTWRNFPVADALRKEYELEVARQIAYGQGYYEFK